MGAEVGNGNGHRASLTVKNNPGRSDAGGSSASSPAGSPTIPCPTVSLIRYPDEKEKERTDQATNQNPRRTCSPSKFKDKKVLVMGLSSTAGDILPTTIPVAAAVHVSHRRGVLPFKRYLRGKPIDLYSTWRRRQMGQALARWAPGVARRVVDRAITGMARASFPFPLPLDNPAWGFEPFPSPSYALPASFELALPYIRDGSLGLLPGVRRFVGPKDIKFADGTVLDDVDSVILCTGYSADWALSAPFMETAGAGPPKQPRLYLNMFPPAYADSCVVQTHCLFGKNNGFNFGDVTAWAVGNLWRGTVTAPSHAAMEAQVDGHHAWLAARWDEDQHCDLSAVRQWEYQQWIHGAAGTSMENLG
ncbi:hypothetical protein B0T26DRAFT_653163 [Lasiosphaeria miniovina]|uniref:Monooxygenase n=1 Tax=Lasiosphaeria miniovina TaxID=1954250 RepID=A0AA40A4U8_9PEZI|nr:uncharacterized protein B0T26DRAFT_653163 [Lasiosphaeria miniovina]KAK0709285.1 hypothetical protein B0T26DRAFT_653163 [Lasiosphaeria miniovina]